MSVDNPTVANAREIVLPDSLQLLLVVLLLALLLCIPIIVLTDHVKRASAILASVSYSQSQSPAAETIPQPDIQGPGALEVAAPIAQLQRGGVAITPQETRTSNRILSKLNQTRAVRGRSMGSTLSRTWFGTNSPRHVTAE